ncbi:hypothetical protein ACFPRL_07365 [Pseudoclavibacter helvolus]
MASPSMVVTSMSFTFRLIRRATGCAAPLFLARRSHETDRRVRLHSLRYGRLLDFTHDRARPLRHPHHDRLLHPRSLRGPLGPAEADRPLGEADRERRQEKARRDRHPGAVGALSARSRPHRAAHAHDRLRADEHRERRDRRHSDRDDHLEDRPWHPRLALPPERRRWRWPWFRRPAHRR